MIKKILNMNINSERLVEGEYFVELPEHPNHRFAVSVDYNRKYPYYLIAYAKPMGKEDYTIVLFECQARTLIELNTLLRKGMKNEIQGSLQDPEALV